MTNNPKATSTHADGSGATKTPTKPATKSSTFIKLLQRARGATSTELIAATDWQAHSVRAFLSGLRKKGQTIVREVRKTGEFAYRLEPVGKAEAVVTAPTANEPVA